MKRLLLVSSALLSCVAWQAQADTITPAVEYTNSSTLTDDRPFTLGYEFTTSVTLDVNALGYWADLLVDSQVGLWDSTGTLLVSTTVLTTDPQTGHFLYHSIPDLLLAPGTYTIGGQFDGNGNAIPFPANATGVVTIPGYTYVADEQLIGSGLNFPTVSLGSYGANGILLVDFSVTSATSTVPEPGTITLLLTGLGMSALLRLRSRKQQ